MKIADQMIAKIGPAKKKTAVYSESNMVKVCLMQIADAETDAEAGISSGVACLNLSFDNASFSASSRYKQCSVTDFT
jgi:hypothetical protein